MFFLAGGVVCSGQPVAPGGLAATAVSTQQINLTWIDNSANELGFRVEQSPDGIAFAPIAATSSNVTAYAATNLNPGIKYYFRVRAFNGSGNSAYSNTSSATTFTPWAQWQLQNFTAAQLTNPAVSGMAADPDGDGLANVVEYALNRQPFVSDNTNAAVPGIETIAPDSFLTLNYTRNAAAGDVLFVANVSSNLTAWSSGTNAVTGPVSVSTTAGLVTEKFRAVAPVAATVQQFMQLTVAYNGVPDSWVSGTELPTDLGQVACAVVGDNLYVFGSPTSHSNTLVYNIVSDTWADANSPRPYPGDHHIAEVYGGKIYLIGGLNGNVDGQVQIYDPATNGWSLGAPMPFAAGSCASALIGGKIYVAGGLLESNGVPVGGTQTNGAAVYDPVANTWAMLAPEPSPTGMNHTASATDGTKLYTFGGRTITDGSGDGNNTLQIYDPSNDTWVSSDISGSTLAPLPQRRGGMGKAVYYKGDFYVMGGETWTDTINATPDKVYNRVDIYNVASNTWRLGTPMPTARHGIFPVLRGNRIYVVGGGVKASTSGSTTNEIYILP